MIGLRIIDGNNTYAVRLDGQGNPIEGQYVDEGTSIITTDGSLKTTEFTTKEVDWAINDAAEKGITGEVLILESQPRSTASDLAVEKLVNEGKTVITVAP